MNIYDVLTLTKSLFASIDQLILVIYEASQFTYIFSNQNFPKHILSAIVCIGGLKTKTDLRKKTQKKYNLSQETVTGERKQYSHRNYYCSLDIYVQRHWQVVLKWVYSLICIACVSWYSRYLHNVYLKGATELEVMLIQSYSYSPIHIYWSVADVHPGELLLVFQDSFAFSLLLLILYSLKYSLISLAAWNVTNNAYQGTL